MMLPFIIMSRHLAYECRLTLMQIDLVPARDKCLPFYEVELEEINPSKR